MSEFDNFLLLGYITHMQLTEKWFISNKKADFNSLGKKFHIDPVTARVLVNRNVSEDDMSTFLSCAFSGLHAPAAMRDLIRASEILETKIKEEKRIRIIGDYDVDGVCSTYILWKALSECGANIDHIIPDRISDGYGISMSMIENSISDGIDTIITCDNGISAFEQITAAKAAGLTVVLTDHHEIPLDEAGNEVIPPADAVINPHLKNDKYPFKEICGAVVAFKLMQRTLPTFLHKEANKVLTELFEFAALATVCDVMPLVNENRVIVKLSLPRMSSSSNLGLRALVSASNLGEHEITAYHLGFVLGPCINAAGRLESANIALDLFKETDPNKAYLRATDLVKLNEKRRSISSTFEEEAFKIVEATKAYDKEIIIIHLSGCHESLAGIIAGRLKEHYQRPAIVFTDDADKNLKGSGRSTDEFDMFTELGKHRNLFIRFGGHKAAAGMSLTKENYEKLLDVYSATASAEPVKKVLIDVPMPLSYCTLPLAEEFKKLEPFGNGNSKPLFAEAGLKIINISVMGKTNSAAKLTLVDKNDRTFTAVYFGKLEEFNQKIANPEDAFEIEMLYSNTNNNDVKVDITYNLDVNSFRGKSEPQMIIKNIRRSAEQVLKPA